MSTSGQKKEAVWGVLVAGWYETEFNFFVVRYSGYNIRMIVKNFRFECAEGFRRNRQVW